MSKYEKNQDSPDPWMIDESNQTWTLGKNATISVANEAAINIAVGNDNNLIKLKGDLDASGAGSEGLRVEGDNTVVQIRKSSLIEAEDGIYNNSTGSLIENAGIIDGKDQGIVSDTGLEIMNRGTISADIAITLFGQSSVTNLKGGLIEGGAIGIRIGSPISANIVNDGKIVADDVAVNVSSAIGSQLINTGKIVGDVVFGSGHDSIHTEAGKIIGEVSGGQGHDKYYIGKHKVDLSEDFNNGYDTVYSSTSYKLRANFEAIELTGDRSVNATGNVENNAVFGNGGDNLLRGKDGDDYVGGGGGDDLLVGGEGSDYFIFEQGDGHDTFVDFDPGDDSIALLGFPFAGFDEVAPLISQHGDDTWISLGGGDRVILRNFDAADLTEDMILFNVPM